MNSELREMNSELREMKFGLREMNFELREMNFELREMNFELREMNFGLRELKFGLREINLSCEVLDSQSHRRILFGSFRHPHLTWMSIAGARAPVYSQLYITDQNAHNADHFQLC